MGPLHPLPVPDERCQSIAIDFIGLLPKDGNYDSIVTITDHLGTDVQIIPTTVNRTAEGLAELFFDKWFCKNGLPLDIISDRDKLFMSQFWKALHKLMGIELKMSTAYHPETDGSSEWTNKTVIQAIRFYVEHNQEGWVRALPQVQFNIMNTVNKSTGFSPFQLRFGRQPRLLPPLVHQPGYQAQPIECHAKLSWNEWFTTCGRHKTTYWKPRLHRHSRLTRNIWINSLSRLANTSDWAPYTKDESTSLKTKKGSLSSCHAMTAPTKLQK